MLTALLLAAALGASPGPRLETHTGVASWYGPGFYGHRTASGDIYTGRGLTAAHKTLPLGKKVLVTNLDNGKYTWVIINDRGPYIRGRLIDLSRRAADTLNIVPKGTGRIRITLVD